jgi:hypothetical protein
MKRNLLTITLVIFCSMVMGSCILDPKKEPPKEEPPPPTFESLKEKDHTLFNLEEAYKQRNIVEYDKLLDDFFVFHFAEADWGADPPKTPIQWGREAERGATANMFDPNFSKPGQDPISSIDITMSYAADNWIAVDSGDQVNYPGETWYQKNIRYTLTITAGDDTFFTNGEISALFVIRLAEVEGEQFWRIVSWHDAL